MFVVLHSFVDALWLDTTETVFCSQKGSIFDGTIIGRNQSSLGKRTQQQRSCYSGNIFNDYQREWNKCSDIGRIEMIYSFLFDC